MDEMIKDAEEAEREIEKDTGVNSTNSTNGTNGTNSTNGTNGTNSTNGTDGGRILSSTDDVIVMETTDASKSVNVGEDNSVSEEEADAVE